MSKAPRPASENPFLDPRLEIEWSRLKPELIEPAITAALKRAQKNLDAIAATAPAKATFANAFAAFEKATEELGYAWHKVTHLDSVENTPALREAHNAMLPAVSAFFAKICLNQKLYSVLKAAADNEQGRLDATRRRYVEETLADFRENGAELPPEGRKRLQEIEEALAAKTQKFSENVLDATNAFEMLVDRPEALSGLPESAVEAARASAIEAGYSEEAKPRWRFTLHGPSLFAVLTYCDHPGIRKSLWEGANLVGRQAPRDNTPLIADILRLREEKAKLLGKAHFPDLILERRMARSGEQALAFVQDLYTKTKPAFDRENAELFSYAALRTGTPPAPLEPWNSAYFAEKMRRERFDFDEEALRPYFPIDGVIGGMFKLARKLFGVSIRPRPTLFRDAGHSHEDARAEALPVDIWHPEVKFYEVFDEESDRHLGSFYTDWHPRPSKRGGAWMDALKTGEPQPGGARSPHLGLMCGNLSKPAGGKPALLTHDEVLTLFHEFGHLLHHLLGEVEIPSLSGIHVAWDFIELPSQILENWCWEREGLDLFAHHYISGEPIPEDLFARMTAARTFHAARAMMRQLSFAKLDLELHLHSGEAAGADDLQAWLRERLDGYLVPTRGTYATLVNRFTHLFASPTAYAAGYYSYKWAEVLDADAFSKFQQEGILSAETGRAFRREVLSQGNRRPPEELYRAFLGRDPDPTALLVRSGLRNAG